jgi:P27 family predicted phage terminase small subunit
MVSGPIVGRRGPQPRPTAVKVRQGETRPSRVNYREPIGDRRAPAMPAGMDRVAKRVWRRVLKTMPASVIQAVDGDLLRVYAESVSAYIEARRLLAADYPTVRGRAPGSVVKNPLHQIVRDNAEQVRQFGRELGIGPASRAALQVAPGTAPALLDIGPPPRLRIVNGGTQSVAEPEDGA